MGKIPEGALITVEFEMRLPISATDDEIDEWIKYELGGGSISGKNPLSAHELEYWHMPPMLDRTGYVGRIEDTGHTPTDNGGIRFNRRYIRERETPS